MKLHGIKLQGPATKTIVLPRQNGNLVFTFQAVLNTDEFNKIYPPPKPPVKKLPGGGKVAVTEDKKYGEELQKWGELKAHWVFLQSISATPGLEWETVDSANPDTWKNYDEELQKAGLTESERLRLLKEYIEVQGLDDDKISQATNSFLAGLQEEKEKPLSQNSDQSDTPSGEVVNA